MIILNLDTTTAKKAKVRISEESKVLVENESETPLISIQGALKKANLNLEQVDKFTANAGPGSYTGIRVGAAVVNSLNFALGKAGEAIEPIYE